MTHILINLEDHWGRVEVHLVLVHQHREASDLLSHRGGHLQQKQRAGKRQGGTWFNSAAPGESLTDSSTLDIFPLTHAVSSADLRN